MFLTQQDVKEHHQAMKREPFFEWNICEMQKMYNRYMSGALGGDDCKDNPEHSATCAICWNYDEEVDIVAVSEPYHVLVVVSVASFLIRNGLPYTLIKNGFYTNHLFVDLMAIVKAGKVKALKKHYYRSDYEKMQATVLAVEGWMKGERRTTLTPQVLYEHYKAMEAEPFYQETIKDINHNYLGFLDDKRAYQGKPKRCAKAAIRVEYLDDESILEASDADRTRVVLAIAQFLLSHRFPARYMSAPMRKDLRAILKDNKVETNAVFFCEDDFRQMSEDVKAVSAWFYGKLRFLKKPR